jgi:cob(I)alamin adenosyltransferase
MPDYFTGRGDDGTTGRLGQGRVPKFDLQIEACGSVDEASAALGLARALATTPQTAQILLDCQRDLYQLMAELAATAETAERFRKIGAAHVVALEAHVASLAAEAPLPEGFIVPGDSPAGGALAVARTTVRRAERQVARLAHERGLSSPHLLAYLNRLSSLCYVLELLENRAAGFAQPTPAKTPRP